MILLRSMFFHTGYWLSTILFSLISLPLWLVSKKTRYRVMSNMARFVIWWLNLTCGLSLRVHGAENLLKEPCVALVRHESAWETFALQQILPRQAWVLKRELLKIPFFGWGLHAMWPIAIDRGAGRAALKQVLDQGQERLADGAWVVVFPEGTRMPAGELGKMNVGGALLAEKAKVPVVLVSHNAGRFWPKGAFLIRSGIVDVYISEPLSIDLSAQQINEQAKIFFQHHLS